MATITEQLNKLVSTKAAIKTAIRGKGVSVADNDTFASYADKIGSIETNRGKFVEPSSNGIYIVKADKSVISQVEFDELSNVYKESCIGIYIKNGLSKPFCLRKHMLLLSAVFQWADESTLLGTTTTDGQSNTAKINAAYPSKSNAANVCIFYGGFLPASDQLGYIFEEATTLNTILSAMGGTSIPTDVITSPSRYILSSSEDSSSYVYTYDTGKTSKYGGKTRYYAVIPVFPIESL